MKGCNTMEENRYVATPGKTFLCFIIYRVVILITSGIVDFFVVSVFLNFLMESVGEDNILFKILTSLILLIASIPNFIVVPLVRNFFIKLYPSFTASSINALLYIGFSYVLGMLFLQQQFYNSLHATLTYVFYLIIFAFYVILYFYYKNKIKSHKVINEDNIYYADNKESSDNYTE